VISALGIHTDSRAEEYARVSCVGDIRVGRMKQTKTILFTILLLTATASHGMGATDDHGRTLQSWLAEASSAQRRGDFAAAAESYRKALEIDPSIPELWANLGLMDHESGKHTEAIQSFKKAIAIKPALFVPQLFLGIEYLEAQNPRGALPFLKTASEINPKDPQAAMSLGRAYSMLDQGAMAAEAYWRATESSPNDGSAWLALGTSYLQQLEEDARAMNSTFKTSPFVTLRAAETLAEQGKLMDAERLYKTALATSAPAPCARAEYAIILLRQKETVEAQKQFQLDAENTSPCPLTKMGTAVVSIVQGDMEAGLSGLSSLAVADPAFVESNAPLYREALSADEITSLTEAIGNREASGKLTPEVGGLIKGAFLSDTMPSITAANRVSSADATQPSSPADAMRYEAAGQYSACDQEISSGLAKLSTGQLVTLASCAFYAGDFRTTSAAAQPLKKNPPTSAQGLYWESKADQKLAIAALAHAGEVEPNSPQMHILLGDVFRRQRSWGEAEAEYRRALALDSKSRSARLNLAIDLFSELKYEEALDLDKVLLAESPDDPEANLLGAEIFAQQHEYEKAEPYLLRCTKLKEDLQARRHILLGQVYSETNRVPEAITEYKMGLSDDHDGSLHYQVARLYQKSGNLAAASEQLRISKQLRKRWDSQANASLEQSSTDSSQR